MRKKPDPTAEALRLANKGMKRLSERIDKVENAEASDESLIDLFREFLDLQNSRMISEIRVTPERHAEPLREIDALRRALRRYDLSRIDLDPRVKLNVNAMTRA